MGDQTSETGQTLYKISESGLEELSIVESEDLYNSEQDNNEARRNYNERIEQKIQEAKLYKRSDTEGKKSSKQKTYDNSFRSTNKKDRSVSPRINH